MTTLNYTGQPGDGYGWGTANKYLKRELARMFPHGDDVVMQPLADHNLTPTHPIDGKKLNFGYSFFEYDLGPKAVENADKFDLIFVGSDWCRERLMDAGIYNGKRLIQGVDTSIFKQCPRTNPQTTIFSGGKFEFRKGQDLVIAAFRDYLRINPTAILCVSWWNPWPQLIATMRQSEVIQFPAETHFENQEAFYRSLLLCNGIPESNFRVYPRLDHLTMAAVMASTDIGLFPNRCEGGTNLVLMEYAACGGIVVANLKTGHRDISSLVPVEIPASTDTSHWAVQDVSEIAMALEMATLEMRQSNKSIENLMAPYSWRNSAETVAKTIQERL